MPKFLIPVTRDCTETTMVDVEAVNPGAAIVEALRQTKNEPFGFDWTPDDNSGDQSVHYCADPDAVVPIEPATPACEPHPDLITDALMSALAFCDDADTFTTHLKDRHLEALARGLPKVREILTRALSERESRELTAPELSALGISDPEVSETACCAWEALLEAKGTEIIARSFERLGSNELRRFACFVAPMIEQDWQSIGGGESYGDPFDWEFVPAMGNARELIGGLAEMLRDGDDAIYDYDVDARIEPIEHEPRDGFWPWTSGGFEVCLPAALSHCWSSGSAPAAIQPLVDVTDELIAEAWAERYPKRPSLSACICDDGIPDEWRREAEEWETESWTSDTDVYFWKARVMFEDRGDHNGDGIAPRVHIDAYLNTDLNYGRDDIPWLRCYGRKADQTWGNFNVSFPLDKFARLQPKHLEALISSARRKLS